MIAQESRPTLGRWAAAPDHIPTDGGFSDFDSKHQQFAVDPRCAPERILAAHPRDQRSLCDELFGRHNHPAPRSGLIRLKKYVVLLEQGLAGGRISRLIRRSRTARAT